MTRPKVIWDSGIEVAPVYGPDDAEKPGEYPYTRGIHPLMYRQRPWTMRQYSGFGTAAETHERFLFLIKNGNTGLNVAFDLPTQCGLDSDDPMAEGEVGRVGMAVDTLADMEEAFADIDLNAISVSLTINGSAVAIMGMYFAMAEKRGFSLSELRGTAQNDILKEFVGRGTWIFPVEPSLRRRTTAPSACAAITSARAERRRRKRWPTVSLSPAPTSITCAPAGSMWTSSRRASPSTSTSTATSGSR